MFGGAEDMAVRVHFREKSTLTPVLEALCPVWPKDKRQMATQFGFKL